MFLSIATSQRPATDLGYLLMKHPDRVHEVELAFGKAVVFFPEASDERCEAVLTLDVDPIGLVRGRGEGAGLLDQYVNDRPYAASSFLSVALNRAFRTAMTGQSRERQALADAKIPLELSVCPLPARGGEALLRSLFEPLGWHVELAPVLTGDAPSRYVSLTLRGVQRLAEALSHLYVLIPVLDDEKHYWVGDDEVEKLLTKAGAWLADHPSKELIALRYLKKRRGLARAALERLARDDTAGLEDAESKESPEQRLEAPVRLNDLRMEAVVGVLTEKGVTSVADLGCGEGKLLSRLVRMRQVERIVGLDASSRALAIAADRLGLSTAGGEKANRVKLLHGALTYRDARWSDVDAATLIEVIEHLDAERIPALEQVVFGSARPRLVVVTTPNVEHNVLFAGLAPGAFRHPDHRFEWTRAAFAAWAGSVCGRFGYAVAFRDVGEAHAEYGPPTQMAVFER